MQESMLTLREKFEAIKSQGYIKSSRNGSTGIGKTFEDLIGKKEDTRCAPDFYDLEIKTKNEHSIRNTTLFVATPKGKSEYEIKRIVNNFGYPDKDIKSSNVLNATIYGNKNNFVGSKYIFRLKVDYESNRLILKILNLNMEIIDDYVYWKFEELKKRLECKLSNLAIVTAKKKLFNGTNYYYYYKLEFYKLKNFETFLELIKDGIICISFHIGVVKYGEKIGKIHDRGTSFQIQEKDITKLFEKINL